jgi:hypothetical protein
MTHTYQSNILAVTMLPRLLFLMLHSINDSMGLEKIFDCLKKFVANKVFRFNISVFRKVCYSQLVSDNDFLGVVRVTHRT